jgi:hypothetical protein
LKNRATGSVLLIVEKRIKRNNGTKLAVNGIVSGTLYFKTLKYRFAENGKKNIKYSNTLKEIMKIVELPSELLLYIRDNIFELSEFNKETWDLDSSLNDYMRSEWRWSWRNFLSASNSVLWQQTRKASMVWDLNHYATRKYLAEESFRDYINSRMTDPSIQLQLNCYQIESYEIIRNSIPAPLHLSTSIGGFDFLHSLVLTYCPNIICLDSFKSLRTLVISIVRILLL